MTNKTIIALAITTAFIAGSMTSGATAYAQNVPPTENPGEPFATIFGLLEAIQMQITDANDAILLAISVLSGDVANVQSDIDSIQSEISFMKSELATIKGNTDEVESDIQTLSGKFDNFPEPLTQFRQLSVGSLDDEDRVTQIIESTGPMLIEVCPVFDTGEFRIQTLDGTAGTNNRDGDEEYCSVFGANAGQGAMIVGNADEDNATLMEITVRTTPSATLTIHDLIIE